jgi:hypothetical protein
MANFGQRVPSGGPSLIAISALLLAHVCGEKVHNLVTPGKHGFKAAHTTIKVALMTPMQTQRGIGSAILVQMALHI